MKIELLKPHTHAGTPYAPGAVIAVDDLSARWLIDISVARPAANSSNKNNTPMYKSEEKSE